MRFQLVDQVFQDIVQDVPAVLGVDRFEQSKQSVLDGFMLLIQLGKAKAVFRIHDAPPDR